MDTTDSGQDTTGPATRRGGSARAGLLGAVVGAGALVGGLVLATGGAGAQPTTAASAAAPAPADEVVQVDDGLVDDELLAELEQAFESYEACLIDNGLIDEGELDELVEFDEGDWDEFEEGDWEEDWDEVHLDSGAIILVEDDNGSTFVEFGDGDGEVTVSKVDGEIAVTTDGDVAAETFTWDELEAEHGDEGDWDEAFEVCDDVLDDIEELEDDYFEDDYFDDQD